MDKWKSTASKQHNKWQMTRGTSLLDMRERQWKFYLLMSRSGGKSTYRCIIKLNFKYVSFLRNISVFFIHLCILGVGGRCEGGLEGVFFFCRFNVFFSFSLDSFIRSGCNDGWKFFFFFILCAERGREWKNVSVFILSWRRERFFIWW